MPTPLYLASRSPRRSELLQQIGVKFSVVVPDVEEIPQPGEAPADYVRRLALSKARAGLSLRPTPGVVLGADTIVVHTDGAGGDQILEKPADRAEAVAMLLRLSAGTHRVMTALAMTDDNREVVRLSITEVDFRAIDADQAARYWETGEPCDKAGGYAIQGLGSVFVTAIRGSYSGVVGLPIETLYPLLTDFAIPCWQLP